MWKQVHLARVDLNGVWVMRVLRDIRKKSDLCDYEYLCPAKANEAAKAIRELLKGIKSLGG